MHGSHRSFDAHEPCKVSSVGFIQAGAFLQENEEPFYAEEYAFGGLVEGD